MGISIPLIVYTHTDMKDVWPMFFGQLKKYIGDTKVYVAVNEHDTQLSDMIRIIYDDSKQYTDRWKDILQQVEEETLMFMHEDMILFDKVDFQSLEKYIGYINDGLANSIKLILAGDAVSISDFDNTLVQNEFARFSVQPTIFKKKLLEDLVVLHPNKNIWDFEQSIQINPKDFMVKIGTEKKRGIYHYDSLVLPYICTAINKGKWNMSEYQKELDTMFMEYGVMPFDRGIV
jgi:predicted AAA+ superfamily ATPase